MAATEEWTNGLAKREWTAHFLRTREFVQYLDSQHNANRTILVDPGLIKNDGR